MTVSILVVDDKPDVADLFLQRFRREVRQGTYAMHFAGSGEQALEKLADGIEPHLIVILSDINMPGMDGLPCSTNCASGNSRPGRSFRPNGRFPENRRCYPIGRATRRPRSWRIHGSRTSRISRPRSSLR
jgi:hypothetical protein